MTSVDSSHSTIKKLKDGARKSIEKTLIVLAAPSVTNNYYKPVFNQIIEYMVNFANIVRGKDEVRILVDKATLPYVERKVPDNIVVRAEIEDIWIRDFAPVIPSRQIKFRYLPNYQTKSIASLIDYSFERWVSTSDLSFKKKSNVILDGGNVVDSPNSKRVILTDRILLDNPQLTKVEAKHQLKHIMGVEEVAIIKELPDDTTGHSDGMIMWVSNDKILLQEMPEPERQKIIDELESAFPQVEIIEVPDYYQHATWRGFTSACNIFVNSIVTDEYIYMPTFHGPHDEFMFNLIQSHTTKRVVTIPAEKVCFMGGSARCLSWQVKGELKNKILELLTGRQ